MVKITEAYQGALDYFLGVGDDIYRWHQNPIRRRKPKAPDRKTDDQARVNFLFGHIYPKFFELDSAQVSQWALYMPYAPLSMHAWNSFVTCNIRKLYPGVPGFQFVADITSPDQSPHAPVITDVTYDPYWDAISVKWVHDYVGTIIIQVFHHIASKRKKTYKKYWKIIGFAHCDADEVFVPGWKLVPGRQSRVTLRALNLRGEVSQLGLEEPLDVPDSAIPDFIGSPRSGDTPLVVQFSCLTTGVIRGRTWDFGDGYGSTDANPVHTYNGSMGQSWHVTLMITTVGHSQVAEQKSNYIKIEELPMGDWLFVCDSDNDRVHKRLRINLEWNNWYGTLGSGDDQLNTPFGIAADQSFIYICDFLNDRLMKRFQADLTFSAKYGTLGAGVANFDKPTGIAVDDTHLFVCDRDNNRIKKHDKLTFSFVSQIGTFGGGIDQFKYPTGIAVDDQHIFICDNANHRLHKRRKDDLSWVLNVGTQGAGEYQFNNPYGIAVDDTYIYVGDTDNHRIVKYLKSNFVYVGEIGSFGTGDDQFKYPKGIAVDDLCLYICDSDNHRIVKRLKADLSYVGEIGTEGVGSDQFKFPRFLAVQQQWAE